MKLNPVPHIIVAVEWCSLTLNRRTISRSVVTCHLTLHEFEFEFESVASKNRVARCRHCGALFHGLLLSFVSIPISLRKHSKTVGSRKHSSNGGFIKFEKINLQAFYCYHQCFVMVLKIAFHLHRCAQLTSSLL